MSSLTRGWRWLALAAAVASLALAFVASGAAASQPEVVGHETTIDTSFVPASVATTPATVVVKLTGKSVAEAQADAGRKLTASEKNQIKAQDKAAQDALVPQITASGGTVLAQFQSALNGIKVQIAPSKLGQLRSIQGVAALLPVNEDVLENATSVPYIGAPTVWSAPTNYHGEGIKIGVIDTGIDYTHANFNGPGTIADYNIANASDTLPANPLWFGPLAPRVKGGYDLAGDAYAGSATTPQPDPNPLDCNGHGSHTAGTAAGSGVTFAGSGYTGPYNSSIYTPNAWRIGPGVAPKADIYSYRVFGCTGSTNLTVDAIDMAFDDGMDVINMSLGSPFGTADDASAVASTNVAKAGMIVVASAGNNGGNPYITGSPATGTGAISVAANDSSASFPGFSMALSTGPPPLSVINANGATVADGTAFSIKVIQDNPATPLPADESLGCNVSDFTWDGVPVAGKMAVVNRGTCARVAKAIFGQQAGAGAVAMINNAAGLPPYEGPIFSNPDTGIPYTVTIPFIGVRGAPSADRTQLLAADGGTATLTNSTVANPNATGLASFTSGGPRNGDSWLKPDVTAPGVSIFSTGNGTGNLPLVNSGTSMAAPHVAGVAALVKQAHPSWKQVQEWKAAIVNTADPNAIGGLTPYKTSRAGTGLVQPVGAVKTNVIALGDTATSALNFGFSELNADYNQSRQVKLRNKGGSAASFTVAQTNAGGRPHSVVLGSTSVTIPAGGEATVNVTLNVPVATVGDASAFREVAGLITFTPTGGSNNGVMLRVPYYLVPRALSGVNATMAKSVTTGSPSTSAKLSNPSGPISGTADFYAWGLEDANDLGQNPADVRAVGIQSFPNPSGTVPDRQLLVFAVNTWNRWSAPAAQEFDIGVDVDNDGSDDYILFSFDFGRVTTGTFDGRYGTFVVNLHNGALSSTGFLASAPTDGSTALLPVRTTSFCTGGGAPCMSSSTHPRFSYEAAGFDVLSDFADGVPGLGKYNPWHPAISQGDFQLIAPGANSTSTVAIDPAEWALTPALGEMIVTLDNKAGKEEAALLPLELK